MTGSSTRSALFALLGANARPSDPVHSRVAAAHPRTHSEEMQSPAFSNRDSKSQRTTHPGDILYWTACLGGAGLLLLFALR
jgi:hypothetical protein